MPCGRRTGARWPAAGSPTSWPGTQIMRAPSPGHTGSSGYLPMTPAVAVVTDSTACLSPELTASGGIRAVPLRVVLGGRAAAEDTAPGGGAPDCGTGRGSKTGLVPAVNIIQVEAILRAGGRVGTASPSPDQFADA